MQEKCKFFRKDMYVVKRRKRKNRQVLNLKHLSDSFSRDYWTIKMMIKGNQR